MKVTLLKRRKRAKYTQHKVARHIGVNRATISKWESGKMLPSTDNLIKLASFYNCSIDELLNTVSGDTTNDKS